MGWLIRLSPQKRQQQKAHTHKKSGLDSLAAALCYQKVCSACTKLHFYVCSCTCMHLYSLLSLCVRYTEPKAKQWIMSTDDVACIHVYMYVCADCISRLVVGRRCLIEQGGVSLLPCLQPLLCTYIIHVFLIGYAWSDGTTSTCLVSRQFSKYHYVEWDGPFAQYAAFPSLHSFQMTHAGRHALPLTYLGLLYLICVAWCALCLKCVM